MPEPFTSHDGADPKGVRAEVHVETGTGIVEKIERSGTSDNYQVKMRCEGLKHPVQGWLRSDDALFPKAQELLENRREVAYRIESKRKPGIDRSIPIAELRPNMDVAREKTIKIMAGLDGMLATEALTNPAEDQMNGTYSANGPQAAQVAGPATAGSGLSLAAAIAGLVTAREAGLPASVVDACTALALAAGANAKQVQGAGVKTDQVERPIQHRARSIEATAWNQFNTDGRINLGSYVAHAALSSVNKAFDLLVERNGRIAASNDAAPAVPKDEQVAAVAKLLLGFADHVQVAAYDGGKPDRNAASHVRARSLVYDAIDRCPIPIRDAEEETEAFKVREMAWREQVMAEALGRWKIAFTLMGAPDSEQAPQATRAPQQPTQAQQTQQSPALSVVPNAPAQGQGQAETAAETATPAALTVVPNATAQPQPNGVRAISFVSTTPHLSEGQPGYEPPAAETVAMLAAMAGHPDVSDTRTVGSLLLVTLGQKLARQNHGPALVELIDHYRSLGEDGPMTFAEDAMLAHQQVASSQAS